MGSVIEAAGGLVWRRNGGHLEVVLAQRPHTFAMQPVSGEFVPNPETDRAVWFTVEHAVERATYDSVKDFVANAEGSLPKP